jgi:pentapeptide MXKDX repeat protein
MALRRLINLVLALCVTVGLALAPVVTPASAMQVSMAMDDMGAMPADAKSSDAKSSDDMSSGAMSPDTMAADMPCCPSEPTNKACPDCPLMAICAMKTVQAGPSPASAMMVRHAVRTSHLYMNDVLADGVVRPPPDHPPRA